MTEQDTPAAAEDTTAPADIDAQAAPEATTEATTEPVEASEAVEDSEPTEGTEATPAARREAAKWRRRTRDAEAQIETLTGRLAVVQRAQAEQIAAEHLADGADMWKDGATIEELLDDEGNLDAEKVAELAAATAAQHPHWSKRTRRLPMKRSVGLASGASAPADRTKASWSSVLNTR